MKKNDDPGSQNIKCKESISKIAISFCFYVEKMEKLKNLYEIAPHYPIPITVLIFTKKCGEGEEAL